MSLIDSSDPDEMLGLLVEYVNDEALTEDDDADRADFLRDLSRELENLTGEEFVAVEQIADAIREIRASQPREFLSDAVIVHMDACIEELRRIEIGSQTTRATAV
ncbi:MAG: hypothetical protein KY432_00280 [Acidobacteria bacterium]|nr:hypothetical protein [Acidobacteriota bacterium]